MTTFAVAALLLIMLPGGDLGVSVHATAAAVGLSALLVASAQAFTVVKILGACYLGWLGLRMLRDAVRSPRSSASSNWVVGCGDRRCGRASNR